MRRRDLIAAVVGGAVVIVLAGGIAWAGIPDSNGVIQGCYDSGGNLKVVSALPCPKGYTPLAWTQRGERGDKGDPGNLALAGRSCPGGSFLTGFDLSGELVCASPGGGGSSGGGDPGPGELLVSPLQLVFPQTQVGARSEAATVTFTNTGPADIFVPWMLAGANATDFVLDGCQAVPAQGTCSLFVEFAPTGLGLRTASLIVQLPSGDLVAVTLSGTGV